MKENTVQLDKSMVLYQPTIVDKLLFQKMEDGSSMFISDIGLLKGLSLDENNASLVEALSVRMEKRPATPDNNLTDDQILSTIKARGIQDPTEIQRYYDALKEMVGNEMNAQDYQDALDKYEKQQKEQVEQPKTE